MKNETLDYQIQLALDAVKAKGSHRAQVHLDQIEHITILTVTIGRKQSIMTFIDGVRAYSYWFDRADRAPLVKKCYYEGMTQKRIAEFMGVCTSTIHKDIRAMRENNELDESKRIHRDAINRKLKLEPKMPSPQVIRQQTDLRDFAFGKTFNA